MTLRQARCAFSVCIAELILYVVSQGYEIALDEGLDRITAQDPTSDHMKNSLHNIGLAQDILLYKDGNYLTQTNDHKILGEFWELLGVKKDLPLAWGGRFNDGNHYSLAWGGKK